ncbi:PIN3 [Candida metapsilosis]|uniref:PIN3 n=1 Tax=Candida metapsilosis TaxID=273372 RepID=A0A8H8DAH5_9ASCO|nr:PIN3 [Candida metapsilosis]
MSAALVNRSLTTVRTELEFLRDSEVITDALYSKLVEALPQKYKKDEKPWDVDVLQSGPVSEKATYAPPSEPPVPAYDEKSSKMVEEFANTHISPPEHPPAPRRDAAPKPVGYCTASFDYAAQEPDDLNLSKGDKLAVVEHLSEDWWKGYKAGSSPEKAGVFPSNYVTVISESEFNASENSLAAPRPAPSPQDSYSSHGPPSYNQPPLSNQPSYGGYAQYPPPSTGYYPPPQQYQQPPPQQVVVGAPEQQQQQQHHSGHESVKKYGSRFGEAALFGAGASVGANIVNSIL